MIFFVYSYHVLCSVISTTSGELGNDANINCLAPTPFSSDDLRLVYQVGVIFLLAM